MSQLTLEPLKTFWVQNISFSKKKQTTGLNLNPKCWVFPRSPRLQTTLSQLFLGPWNEPIRKEDVTLVVWKVYGSLVALGEDSHDMSPKSSMKEHISLTSLWCYLKWKAFEQCNIPFSIGKWYNKSSINELVQEKNSCQDQTIAYHLHAWIWLYICFNQNKATCLEKVYSPDSDSFYIQKPNINLSISLHQQFWVLVRIRSSKISPQIELPHPIELSELDEVEEVSSLSTLPFWWSQPNQFVQFENLSYSKSSPRQILFFFVLSTSNDTSSNCCSSVHILWKTFRAPKHQTKK